MAITFHKVVPLYLEKEKIAHSEVWDNVLELQKGKHYHFSAVSGRGKTSFIHFLYGLRDDYSGELTVDGVDQKKADREKVSALRKEKMSVVFQDLRLFADNTLMQNLKVKHALSPFVTETDIRNMAEQLGIAGKLDQLARHCSYGEQQRAAIIRSLLQPFDYLLLDEPMSHLDDLNREKSMQLILQEAQKREAAVIMADLRPSAYFKPHQTIAL